MFQSQGAKTMLDLHGLKVKEVKKLLEDYFTKIEQFNLGEIYIITGKGNHINSDGSSGVLKKLLPKLLKPYCQAIHQINQEIGAYKIILKPQQEVFSLKNALLTFLSDDKDQIQYATFLKEQAEKDDIEAMLALAIVYLHQAIEGFNNINEGIALLIKAKQLGSLEADVQLGVLYYEGLIVKQNHKKAFKYFYYAATQGKGHPVAQYYVAVCYLHGKGVKYNDEKAVEWMKKAADQGDVYAQFTLSDFYLLGKITQQNNELGIYYKTQAAEQGSAEAQLDLARCYATGHGVKQNYQTAFKWYLCAAQFDKAYAVYQVGSYILDGRSGSPPNASEAFHWFLKAAKLGDADGQAQVAYYYLFGEEDIKQDVEQGLAWVTKAIEQKNQYGYYVMATAYLEGVGVQPDALKAHHFMKLAAEAGFVIAQYELGLILMGNKPSSIPCNFKLGVQWLEKASAQNHIQASEVLRDLDINTEISELKTSSLLNSSFFKIKKEHNISKKSEFSNMDYYELGELAYYLLTLSWFIENEADKGYFKEDYAILYKEFIKGVNSLMNLEPPTKQAEEKLTAHLFNYFDSILKLIGEESLFAIYFNTGFKVMAVKLKEFTADEENTIKDCKAPKFTPLHKQSNFDLVF